MKVLVFAGAGVSAELGVPAMRAMAEAFRDHLRDNGYPRSAIDRLERLLEANEYDMEGIVDDLDSTARGAAAESRWGLSTSPDLTELQGFRSEAEWLVSHLCERVDVLDASRLWGPALRMSADELTIATTNYDRGVELAAVQASVPLDDGFPAFQGAELVEWSGFEEARGLRLLKVHGSTDWYHDDDRRRTWKLRHAMPVFGEVRVSIEAGEPIRVGSALVLPSREKTVTYPPYPDVAFEFRRAADAADIAVFVGTSLRDPDLLALVQRCADRKPTFVVGRSFRAAVGRSIQTSASRFLISSLPRLVSAGDLDSAVSIAESEAGRPDPILGDVVVALDRRAEIGARCTAIDALASSRTALQAPEVEALLRDDADDVRTFALGLVRDSPDAETVAPLARDLAAGVPDTEFAREAAVLDRLA